MPLIHSATLPHLAKGPLGVLGDEGLGVGSGALERRECCGVADVAKGDADITQHASALVSLHREAVSVIPNL